MTQAPSSLLLRSLKLLMRSPIPMLTAFVSAQFKARAERIRLSVAHPMRGLVFEEFLLMRARLFPPMG